MQENYTIRYDIRNMNAVAEFMIMKNDVFKNRAAFPEIRALADLQKAVHLAIDTNSFEKLKQNLKAGVSYEIDGHSGVMFHLHITQNKKSVTSTLVTLGEGNSDRFQTEIRQSALFESGIEFEPVFYMHPGKFFSGALIRLNVNNVAGMNT